MAFPCADQGNGLTSQPAPCPCHFPRRSGRGTGCAQPSESADIVSPSLETGQRSAEAVIGLPQHRGGGNERLTVVNLRYVFLRPSQAARFSNPAGKGPTI